MLKSRTGSENLKNKILFEVSDREFDQVTMDQFHEVREKIEIISYARARGYPLFLCLILRGVADCPMWRCVDFIQQECARLRMSVGIVSDSTYEDIMFGHTQTDPERAREYCEGAMIWEMDRRTDVIVIANPNIRKEDYQFYVNKAKAAGTTVYFVEFRGKIVHGNDHFVDQQDLLSTTEIGAVIIPF